MRKNPKEIIFPKTLCSKILVLKSTKNMVFTNFSVKNLKHIVFKKYCVKI